ncbi:MAG TPA: MgtC/SapB family protein [Flavobacteriaceae bacterium]|nr:MgtC/SapB family protein [Flavobacteriaceae bacterium]
MEELLIDHESFQLTQMDFLIRLAVGLGIGFLIGLEREHAALTKTIKPFAGIRTIILVVLYSFLTMMFYYLLSPWILIVSLMGLFGLVSFSYFIVHKDDAGGTTELSVIISFFLGILTFLGFMEISLAITMIVVGLLSSKIRLHRFIGTITTEELVAVIRFGVIALLIFPFLPNYTIDPYDVINLREVGLIVLLTSGLSFIGYILMRVFGKNYGILLTGIVGGLVSSTMITWIFSKKSKEHPSLVYNCMVAIMAASAIMMIRVLAWVFVFNPPLLKDILLPISIVILTSLGCTYYYNYKAKKQHNKQEGVEEIPLGKPLNLRTAVFFAFVYMGVLLFISFSQEQFGDKGIYLTSAIASLTDVNAITISLTQLAGESLTFLIASNAIILGTLSNTIIKIGIALYAGSKELRKMVYFGYGMIFLSGMVAFLILNL